MCSDCHWHQKKKKKRKQRQTKKQQPLQLRSEAVQGVAMKATCLGRLWQPSSQWPDWPSGTGSAKGWATPLRTLLLRRTLPLPSLATTVRAMEKRTQAAGPREGLRAAGVV
jgi:hypothetical protein